MNVRNCTLINRSRYILGSLFGVVTKAWPNLIEPNPCSPAAQTFFMQQWTVVISCNQRRCLHIHVS